MDRIFALAAAAAFSLAACSKGKPEPAPSKTVATKKAPVTPDSVAYFAGGCFWGVEYFLEKMPGVASVESGYMGGTVEKPSYEDVLTKKSGHYEAVRVRYDSKQISYRAVAKRFFEIHDPTQADGQGPDLGPQYRSAVFFSSDAEKNAAAELMKILVGRGYKVVTELLPATTFWPAEGYHQDYYERKGGTPYCHAPVDRFGG